MSFLVELLVSPEHRGKTVWPGATAGDTVFSGKRCVPVPTRTASLWRANSNPIFLLGIPHLFWTLGILLYRYTGGLYTQLLV